MSLDGAENSADPDDTTQEPPTDVREADDDFHPFDEESEDFQPRPGKYVTGADGLPKQVDESSMSDIPALSPSTLVCMGIEDTLVLREQEWGAIVFSTPASAAERTPSGKWRIRSKVIFADPKVLERYPDLYVLSAVEWTELQPIRPVCEHYVRQQTPQYNAALPVGTKPGNVRLCSARRNTEGAFMRINEMFIGACSMRSPRDFESERTMDDFDKRKVHEGQHRVYLPIKGDDTTTPPPGGICGG